MQGFRVLKKGPRRVYRALIPQKLGKWNSNRTMNLHFLHIYIHTYIYVFMCKYGMYVYIYIYVMCRSKHHSFRSNTPRIESHMENTIEIT